MAECDNSGPLTVILGGNHINLTQPNQDGRKMPVSLQAIDGPPDDNTYPRGAIEPHPRHLFLNDLQRVLQRGRKELFWLRGPVGAGKTTVIRQLRENLQKLDDSSRPIIVTFLACDEKRTPSNNFITTIVHQLQQQGVLDRPVDEGEYVYTLPFKEQAKRWIVQPLTKKGGLNKRILLLIDSFESLANCPLIRRAAFDSLLYLLSSIHPAFSILVTSRYHHPPTNDSEWSSAGTPEYQITRLSITDQSKGAVREFYQSHLPLVPPQALDLLVDFTAGSFGLAAYFVSHLLDRRAEPGAWTFPATHLEARRAPGFRGLDNAYRQAFQKIPHSSLPDIEKFLAHALTSPPLQFCELVSNAGLNGKESLLRNELEKLQGIISLKPGSQFIKVAHFHILHAFLFDHTRYKRFVGIPLPPDHSPPRHIDRIGTSQIRDLDSDLNTHEYIVVTLDSNDNSAVLKRVPVTDVSDVEKTQKILDDVVPPDMPALRKDYVKAGVCDQAIAIPDPAGQTIPMRSKKIDRRPRRVHVGDISGFSKGGALDVRFNILLTKRENAKYGFTCPKGFRPLRLEGLTDTPDPFPPTEPQVNGYASHDYGSARIGDAVIEGQLGQHDLKLPRHVVCETPNCETSGGLTVMHNGYTISAADDLQIKHIQHYLAQSASAWDWEDPILQSQNRPLLCVTSAVYTDVWTSVAFRGTPPTAVIAEMTPDTVQPLFYRWIVRSSGIKHESYNWLVDPNLDKFPRPGNPQQMTNCVGINAAIVRPPPKIPEAIEKPSSRFYRSLSPIPWGNRLSLPSFVSESPGDTKKDKKRKPLFRFFSVAAQSAPRLVKHGQHSK